jgi:transcriptional regulator with XRE-family HTH domain
MAFSRSPAKELARVIGRTPKGAELLLRGEVAPSVETLIAACREFDTVWEEFRDLCGRANSEGEAERLLSEITLRLKERRPS